MFPPLVAGGAARMGQFARLLPEYGWDVTVLTARHGEAAKLDHRAADETRARVIETWSPSSVVHTRGTPTPKRGLAGVVRSTARTLAYALLFPDREIFWVPGAIEAGRQELRNQAYDAIIATYAPASALVVGHALARSSGLPFVVDFRDLWSTLPMPVFPTRAHRAAARAVERSIVRSASRITAVSPAMAEDIADLHGLPRSHAISITNGFQPSDLDRVRDDRGPEPRPFRLVYTGTVHMHYDLEPFWRALRELADAGTITPENFRVEFVGNLAAGDVHSHGLDELVEIKPFVPHDQVFDVLARADALLVIETPGYYARYGYAAKVFDYVLTGKPVVAVVEQDGNTWRLLRDLRVGHCVAPGDATTLRDTIGRVLALKNAPPRRVDPDVAPLREFNRRHLVGRLAQLLDDIVPSDKDLPHAQSTAR